MWTGAGIDVVVPDVGRLVAELIVAVAVVNGCCVIITWTLQYQCCQVLSTTTAPACAVLTTLFALSFERKHCGLIFPPSRLGLPWSVLVDQGGDEGWDQAVGTALTLCRQPEVGG